MNALFAIVGLLILTGCASAEKKIARESTSELKLRHAQLRESLGYDKGEPDIDFLKPVWMRGPSRSERIEEKEGVERELLRRWKAGDKDAHLEIFGAAR